jgi:Raf kinase inhibitor-like YbhB/YbcL family protein
MALEISSTVFPPGGAIPLVYTCDGKDRSPSLSWSGAPPAAQAMALICEDPDAPAGTWVHWVIFNIPASSRGLKEGVSAAAVLDDGSRQGKNDFGRIGYGGPCPPQGKPHRYVFTLYALDRELALQAGCRKADLLAAMKGRVLATASMFATYKR